MSGLPLTELSARALAKAVRKRTVTSRAVVEAHIDLLERVNPTVNAVVATRFEAARAEADAADVRADKAAAEGDQDSLPPLLGVPCTIKEAIAVAGLPNAAGVVARRNHVALESATVTRRLLGAGAILLGVTNTSELCMWVESENRIYGRTRNPYDPTRIAGGSSGGEGAAVGSGASPIGLGSDVGGSIRIPAFCCGVFGHKPSLGLVPHTGSWPLVTGETGRMFVIGPLARRAEDLMPLLRIIAGPDGVDPVAEPAELGDPAAVPMAGMRVLISEDAWPLPTSRELLLARERAATALAAAGARVERQRMRHLRRAFELYVTTLSRTAETSVRGVLLDAGCDPVTVRAMLRRGGPHTVATRLVMAAEWVEAKQPGARARRVVAAGRALAEEMAATVGDGVLLHPPLATAAPRHGRTVGRPWWINHAALFNLAALPVTQVPLGLGRAGLPLGVQVVAGPGRDHVSIAVALELERAFGGWTPPPLQAMTTPVARRPRLSQRPPRPQRPAGAGDRDAAPRIERPGSASVRVPSRTVN